MQASKDTKGVFSSNLSKGKKEREAPNGIPSNMLESYSASASAFEAQAKMYEDARKNGKKGKKDAVVSALYNPSPKHKALVHAESHLYLSRTEKLIFGATSHHNHNKSTSIGGA